MTRNSSEEPLPPSERKKAEGPVLRPVSSEDFEAASETETPSGILRGRGLWILALLLAAVLVAYGAEFAHSRGLEAKIVNLEVKLASAEAELVAYEQRMREVRGAVFDLSARLDQLHGLVNRPVDGDASGAAAPESPGAP